MSSITPARKTGILLINLGTPDDPSVRSVRRYLREFLLDPRVIDLPFFWRYLLVYGLILPFRPFKAAHAYKKIWQPAGSPLRTHTQAFAQKLAVTLGSSYQVSVAMRYGNPTMASALAALANCKKIIVLPLFPQYSSAATGSALAHALRHIAQPWNIPELHVIDSFYARQEFIDPWSTLLQPYLVDPENFLLFSYHGLPERHIDKSHCQAACQRIVACPSVDKKNYFCYRAQCYQTTRLLAQKLALTPERYTTSFQSRLGRIPWIQPYTENILPQLYAQGIRKLVVACPAFVADCLETLEEIGMQAQEQWHALGGESFALVPCLNDHPAWVQGVTSILQANDSDS